MSENAGTTGTPAAPAAGTQTPALPPATPETPRTPEDWAAALARSNKESADRRHALKELQAKSEAEAKELADLKAKIAAQEAEKLKAQGEWQKLAESEQVKAAALAQENASLKAKADKFEAGLKARETVLMEKIPEAARAKLKLDSMPLEDRVSTLETLAEMIGTPAAPSVPAGAPNVSTPPAGRTAPGPKAPQGSRADQVRAIREDRSLSPRQKAQKLAALPKE
jgi:hypothetical protein